MDPNTSPSNSSVTPPPVLAAAPTPPERTFPAPEIQLPAMALFQSKPENGTAETPRKEPVAWGALIGIIIIVLALIVGALYFWGQELIERDERESLVPVPTEEAPSTFSE